MLIIANTGATAFDTQLSLLKFNVEVFLLFNGYTQNTHFVFPHKHWDYSVSGATLMSHGGHFLLSPSLLFALLACDLPVHPLCICFFTFLIFYHLLSPPLLSHLLLLVLNLYHSISPTHCSPPERPPSLTLTHPPPSVSYYTNSSGISSMWNLPQKDISYWTALSRGEREMFAQIKEDRK